MLSQLSLRVIEISDRIKPLLAGHGQDIQGAVLGDLVATFVAAHFSENGAADTAEFREMVIEAHIGLVRNLLPLYDKALETAQQKRH